MNMLDVLTQNQGKILTSLLVLSELLAFLFPNSGGIVKGLISVLKAIGAKDMNQ